MVVKTHVVHKLWVYCEWRGPSLVPRWGLGTVSGVNLSCRSTVLQGGCLGRVLSFELIKLEIGRRGKNNCFVTGSHHFKFTSSKI